MYVTGVGGGRAYVNGHMTLFFWKIISGLAMKFFFVYMPVTKKQVKVCRVHIWLASRLLDWLSIDFSGCDQIRSDLVTYQLSQVVIKRSPSCPLCLFCSLFSNVIASCYFLSHLHCVLLLLLLPQVLTLT